MTEPTTEQTENTTENAADATPSAGTGRGRPRPSTTVERDQQALAKLTEAGADGLTREDLATALGISPSEAYLCVYRLSRQDPPVAVKRRRDGKVRWLTSDNTSAFDENEAAAKAAAKEAREAAATSAAGDAPTESALSTEAPQPAL